MQTEHRSLCEPCRTSYAAKYATCPKCRQPLVLTEVLRVDFTRDVPVAS